MFSCKNWTKLMQITYPIKLSPKYLAHSSQLWGSARIRPWHRESSRRYSHLCWRIMWHQIAKAKGILMRAALRLIMILRRANILMVVNSRPKLRRRFRKCWIKDSTSLTSIFFSIPRSTFSSKPPLKLIPSKRIEMSFTSCTISVWI